MSHSSRATSSRPSLQTAITWSSSVRLSEATITTPSLASIGWDKSLARPCDCLSGVHAASGSVQGPAAMPQRTTATRSLPESPAPKAMNSAKLVALRPCCFTAMDVIKELGSTSYFMPTGSDGRFLTLAKNNRIISVLSLDELRSVISHGASASGDPSRFPPCFVVLFAHSNQLHRYAVLEPPDPRPTGMGGNVNGRFRRVGVNVLLAVRPWQQPAKHAVHAITALEMATAAMPIFVAPDLHARLPRMKATPSVTSIKSMDENGSGGTTITPHGGEMHATTSAAVPRATF